jgi:sulfite reductase (NADPH) hemoprotein beta-component
VALPTCGLALAESERYLPDLVTEIEAELDALGLREEAIIIRMTGCPNGCARPYLAEIGLVGKAPGKYNLYLGAAFDGSRLARLYKEAVKSDDIVSTLRPFLTRYRDEREPGERFGDFCLRVGIVEAYEAGTNYHIPMVARDA